MKTVMILGAGVYQVPLIKKAKQLGLRTVVSSIEGNYPGFELADKVYYGDTTDSDKILKIAKQENIDAILTSGTDVAVASIGYVNDALGLCGVSRYTAGLTTDKANMKKAFTDNGVRTATFQRVQTKTEAKKACRDIGFPVVFKCVDKSGSRGVMRVDNIHMVESAYDYVKSASLAAYIIVEKFLCGSELGVDGYIDGDTIFLIPHQKLVFHNGVTDVPIGHAFPYVCEDELYKDIVAQAEKAVHALALRRGFFNMDIMVCEGRAYIIEVGARTGATCIPELMGIYCGWNLYERMLRLALGQELPPPTIAGIPCMAQLIISRTDGILSDWNDDVINSPGVVELSMDYPRGSFVRHFRFGPDRLGHIIVQGDNAKEKLSTALENLSLKIKPIQ